MAYPDGDAAGIIQPRDSKTGSGHEGAHSSDKSCEDTGQVNLLRDVAV
jgi:hypothetical protein